jgi:hypothetical protein
LAHKAQLASVPLVFKEILASRVILVCPELLALAVAQEPVVALVPRVRQEQKAKPD